MRSGTLLMGLSLMLLVVSVAHGADDFISDVWSHSGETSAVIACWTSAPAKVRVEYGPTKAYSLTAQGDRVPRYMHVVRLKGLTPGKVIHFRLVASDAKGVSHHADDATLTPRRIENAVRIPEGFEGEPPYLLDKANTTYVLTKDITTPGTAFHIKANDVTVELDGHAVNYGKDLSYEEPEGARGWLDSGHGVMFPKYGVKKPRVLNGFLLEATPKEKKNGTGRGHNPICGNGVREFEFAGLTMVYAGKDIRGIALSNSGGGSVHHCVIEDKGTHITNRHVGLDAIGRLPKAKVHHNLIRRVRHRGINAGNHSEIHHNEIHIDSWATNAYGVMCIRNKGAEVHHNAIFGSGYHVIGVGTVAECEDVTVHHNHIELAGEKRTKRSTEYGAMSGMNGVRVTWGGKNLLYHDNTIIITGKEGSNLRGTWFCSDDNVTGVVFRDNFVRVIALDEKAHVRGAFSCCGQYRNRKHGVTLYENNRVITNVTHIRFGEGYGVGSNHHFVGNTFIREGEDTRYKTISVGHGDYPTTGHVLLDNKFENGAGLDNVKFVGGGDEREFTVKWNVTVSVADAAGKPVPDADVIISDKAGTVVFRGKTSANGVVTVPLAQYVHKPGGKEDLTPHQILVRTAGGEVQAQVIADANKNVKVAAQAPAQGAKAAGAKFLDGAPSIAKAGDAYVISFKLFKPTDVTVRIVGPDGEVVRHLACGVVGLEKAASPLAPKSLSQKVLWHSKDDAGKLVEGRLKGKDTVHISFRRLMEKVKLDGGRSFYSLRKTGATMVESIDPLATEMYLSHTEKGMRRHYAERDWGRLERALRRMEQMLTDVLTL